MKLEKVTSEAGEPERRRYDDACGTALALEFVGERWSLLVMRELAYGPRRFVEVKANLPGISANVLTQRLAGLERAGIVERRRLPSPANVQVYALTEWGGDTVPIMGALGRWAARSPRHDRMAFMSPASAMMSLEALIDPAVAARQSMTVAFVFPTDRFFARVDDGRLTIRRGEAADADVVFAGDTMALRHTIYGKRPLSRSGEGNTLAIEGDMATAARFVAMFSLPAKFDAQAG